VEFEAKIKRGSRESKWVASLRPLIAKSLRGEASLRVDIGERLPYRHEIHSYKGDGQDPMERRTARYQTDLLIWEMIDRGWVPRVVIECKIGSITTHDALTYSAKAATHKQVHPYLRYGILIGDLAHVPMRLLSHGAHFDFMAAWRHERPSPAKWQLFARLLMDEVRASRLLSRMTDKTSRAEKHTLIHRPFVLPALS
jgi:hypothetical protein